MSEKENLEQALEAIEEFIQQNENSNDEQKIAEAYFDIASLNGNAENFTEAQKAFQEVILRFCNNPNDEIQRLVAMALRYQADTLIQLKKEDEALNIYKTLITVYKNSQNADIQQQVTAAYFNIGAISGERENIENAAEIFKELIIRFQASDDVTIQKQVADAYLHLDLCYRKLSQNENAIEQCQRLIDHFCESMNNEIIENVATAYITKCYSLAINNRHHDLIYTANNYLRQFRQSQIPKLQKITAHLLFGKSLSFIKLERNRNASNTLKTLIDKYSDSQEIEIQQVVAMGYFNQGAFLGQRNKLNEAHEKFKQFIDKFKTHEDISIQHQIARACNTMGHVLNKLGKHQQAIHTHEKVINKHENNENTKIQLEVAIAFLQQGIAYESLPNSNDKEIASYNRLIDKFKDSKNSNILLQVAMAHMNKAIILETNNEYDNALGSISCLLNMPINIFDEMPKFEWIISQFKKIQVNKIIGNERLTKIFTSLIAIKDHVDRYKPHDIINETTQNIETDDKKHFYHYTRSDVLAAILPIPEYSPIDLSFRIGSLENVNDPEEGMELVDFCEKCPEKCSKLFKQFINKRIDPHISNRMFSISFSSSKDKLDLWRLYGNDADGICIGFPKNAFDSNSHGMLRYSQTTPDSIVMNASANEKDNGHQLGMPIPVIYDKKTKYEVCQILRPALKKAYEILESIRNERQNEERRKDNYDQQKIYQLTEAETIFCQSIQGLLLEVLYSCKSEEYKSEQELRFLVFHPSLKDAEIDTIPTKKGNPPRIFLKTKQILFKDKGYKIHIGPKVKNPRITRLEMEYRLAQYELDQNVDIDISQIKYR